MNKTDILPTRQVKRLVSVTLVVMAILFAPLSAIAAQVVDINRADAATMIENWKGIGEKKAKAIVAYRKKNGRFADINDLANVKGIGEGIIKNNRKYMSVTKGVSTASTKSSAKKSTAKKSTTSNSTSSSSSKKTTTKKTSKPKSKAKKSVSKKSKTSNCKAGSTDKNCKKKKKKKKKKASTT